VAILSAGQEIDPATEAAIRAVLASGKGILKVARELGTGSSVVQRIKAEAAATV
jgi:DNA invertase Pin-like site-specific DNA recombinase